MAKTTRSESSVTRLKKEISDLTQALEAVKRSSGSAYMLRINTDDPEKGEYRVLRQFYHLRKDAVHDMNYHFEKLFGKGVAPDAETEFRKEYTRDDGFTFVATINRITII